MGRSVRRAMLSDRRGVARSVEIYGSDGKCLFGSIAQYSKIETECEDQCQGIGGLDLAFHQDTLRSLLHSTPVWPRAWESRVNMTLDVIGPTLQRAFCSTTLEQQWRPSPANNKQCRPYLLLPSKNTHEQSIQHRHYQTHPSISTASTSISDHLKLQTIIQSIRPVLP